MRLHRCCGCGAQFSRYTSQGACRFCSRRCANRVLLAERRQRSGANWGRHQFSQVAVQCLQCRQPFRTSLGRSRSAKFCSTRCYHLSQGTDNRRYVQVSRGGQRIYEHRWVMQQHVGRPLLTTEHVHHINGDRRDNRLENLLLCLAREHRRLHNPAGSALLLGPADRSLSYRA